MLFFTLAVGAVAIAAEEKSRPQTPSTAIDEKPQTRIDVDPQTNVIAVIIKDELVGWFDENGLHVNGSVSYSGSMQDTNTLSSPAAEDGSRP